MNKASGNIISFFKKRKKLSVVFIVLIIAFVGWRVLGKKSSQQTYQTAAVEKGTLVVSLGESGTVAVANRASVTTQASGVISQVYVNNGDTLTIGEKIAEVSLDQTGQQRQAQAYSQYLSSKNSLDSANNQLYSLQSTMFTKWNTYLNLAQNSTYQNGDGTPNTTNRTASQFMSTQDDWLAAEAAYNNQQNVIIQAQAGLTSAYLSYQSASSTITAPGAGTITDLAIAPGMQIGGSSNTTGSSTSNNSNTATTQFIANIKNEGNPVVTTSLSEVDATKVKSGQKATITFDALPGKDFTGKVLAVNTTGQVSSGVTTYPANIILDVPNDSIFPNMSANVNIIANVKNNVLLVPSGAVQTVNSQSIVRVLKNGRLTIVPVQVGDSSDTQTEIISGVNAGDTVVTSFVLTGTGTTSSSPFSGGLRVGGGGFGGGNATFRSGGR